MTTACGAPTAVADATVMVATGPELERRCDHWLRQPALGVDTEFVRERTFYPDVGLIQVSDGREHALVDPLALDDLEPMARVLLAPRVTKVFHACGEDLETLFHLFGRFPRPIFDTQIAAAFAGLGSSLGYGRLVEELFGLELPKGETRSDWLRRPLRRRQCVYAALDVAYLLPAHELLSERLRQLGRQEWALQEVEQLADERRFLPAPDTVYLSFGRSRSMSRRELGVLRAVAAWREREARRRNLPRNFVLPKAALTAIARGQPRDLEALKKVRGVRPADRRRHGRTLIALVESVLRLPPEELPPRRRRPLRLSPYRHEVVHLRRAVARKAGELGLPAELLATRKTVEQLVRRAVAGKMPTVPLSIRPWRREILTGLLDMGPARDNQQASARGFNTPPGSAKAVAAKPVY